MFGMRRHDTERYEGFHGHWIQQWDQITGGCNWYTFDVAKCELEWDKMLGGVEVTFVILGLGFYLRYNYQRTERLEEIVRRRDEVMADIEGTTKPLTFDPDEPATDAVPTPFSWECRDYGDGWIPFPDLTTALAYQQETGCAMRPVWAES